MPPYNNQMFPSGMGIPQPPGPMGAGGQMPGVQGGIDPQMFQQYLRIMQTQGQQNGPGMQPPNPGMQSLVPDQGMNQAPMGQYGGQPGMGIPQPPGPSAPPGWGSIQTKPGMGGMGSFDPNMNDHQGPGGPFGYRGNGMGGSGPFMPPGMEPGQGQLQQKPMFRDMRGQMPQGPGAGTPPAQPQPRMPPMPRLPPGAGEWTNPLTKQVMNRMPKFSGQRPPEAQPTTSPPSPGGGSVNDVPGSLASPADPIRVPLPASGIAPEDPGMVSNMDKPRKAQGGAPPFNPTPQATGRKWQPSQKPQTRDEKKASVATRKFTSAAVR